MKAKILLILFLLPFFTVAQIDFSKYFINKSFRFDFLLGGNNKEVQVFPQQMKQESYWAGSGNQLIDPFNYGSYRIRVYDPESDILIYSRGFSTLFQEWQTTAEAKKTVKTFYQSAIFPYPKNIVRLEIDARQWEGNFNTIYSTTIDPDDYFILKETPPGIKSVDIFRNGSPEHKVDLVVLAEGYTSTEMEKFVKDTERLVNYLFSTEPFKTEKENFNVHAILSPSLESGTDVPGENIYKNTCFNSTFYTFDLPRYLTSGDMKNIYDAASIVPYDLIYMLVNTERYGGGGFYNFLTVCSSNNQLSEEVFVHELGHGLAGLGDEYYNSTVAYEDFYNLQIEPWEANLTTLVDFDKKWKDMISDSTKIPTPRIARFNNTVGVYEGGGYMNKGIYSPYINCRMKSNTAHRFCPVCSSAIKRVIDFYTK